ncbi:MAG: CDP-glycerol glycerophosphotransferase family protein [Sporolactobacillus sp.]|nr:CDP-glycerol glycerophosphotransferase family protein [Sporolactobacillus sp.]
MSNLLSLCMIVKNEEKVLKRCLDSVKGGVDEIIIVDTGSTDVTKKIAAEYTHKIYDYQWTNSFAEARNYAQSKATGEWILALDADEFVYIDNLLETRKQLADPKNSFLAFDTKIYSFTGNKGQFTMQHRHTRIYRNQVDIKYRRTIHEQLYKGDQILPAGLSKLIIYHSGYLNTVVQEKNKRKRNKSLIDKEVQKIGMTGFDYFNLANEYASMGDSERGFNNYVLAFQHKPALSYSWVSHCLVQMVNCLISLRRYDDALHVIRDAESIYVASPDFQVQKSHVYLLQGRLFDAEQLLQTLVNHKEKYTNIISSPDYLDFYPYKWLGMIYEQQHNDQQAVKYYSQAINFNANDVDLINRYFKLLISRSSADEVAQFIIKERMTEDQNNLDKLVRAFVNTPELFSIIESLIHRGYFTEKIGFKLKKMMMEGRVDAACQLLNSLHVAQLVKVLNEGYFDFIDLLLLCLVKHKIAFLKSFAKVQQSAAAVIFFLTNSKASKGEMKPQFYLSLLARCIAMRQFDLFAELLQLKKRFAKTISLKIGHLLYATGFHDLAVQCYQSVNISLFDEETFMNLITESEKRNLLDAEFNFCRQAVENGYYNFRILSQMAKVAHRIHATQLLQSIQQMALKCYPDSLYIKENTIWGKKRQKIALIDTALPNSNITALMRKMPAEVTMYAQLNRIKQNNSLDYFNKVLAQDVIITTEGNYPFKKDHIDKQQKVIELWHGFPLKAMGMMDASETNKNQIASYWRNVDAVISYSDIYNRSMEKCFGIPQDKFYITGSPRNDLLFQTDGKQKLTKIFKMNEPIGQERFIFYMPTWRHTNRLNRSDGKLNIDHLFGMNEFNQVEFETFLKRHHYKLIVKLHPADESVLLPHLQNSSTVYLLTTDLLEKNNMDIYDLLAGADMLITDYSSVYFDFLLLDRPLVFTPVDLQAYQQSRGFILQPYEEWTPGPKAISQEKLQQEISHSLQDKNYYHEERAKIKNMIHHYQDDRSTERTWQCILHFLGDKRSGDFLKNIGK